MKRFISFGALLLIMAGLLVSCYENVLDETLDEFISFKGKIDVKTNDDVSYEGCDVVTTSDEIELLGDEFEVRVPNNGVIQSVLILDENDEVYLMARIQPTGGKTIEINEFSTALALVTMHPLLLPIGGRDYDKLEEMVTSCDKFELLVDEITNVVAAKRSLYDSSNENLLIVLNDVCEAIAARVKDDFEYSGSLEDLLEETWGTKALYENPKIYPFHADLTANVLTLRNVGLTPSYYGQVYEANGTVTPFSVPARSDYGGMDLFKENIDEFMLGDPRTFAFTEQGNYQFNLSRMNAAATADFWLRLANSVLTSLGLSLGNDVVQEVGNAISRAMINANSGVNDTLTDPMEWVCIAYGAVAEWMRQDYWEVVGKGGVIRLGNVLVSSLNFYNKIKGIFNASVRLAHSLSAPEEVNFCLCYKEGGEVVPCSESALYIVEGNNQVGYPNQRLLLPLTVYVQVLDEDGNYIDIHEYSRVKFEVVSGGGELEDEYVSADHNHEAYTYWTLGEDGEQKVRAVVVDFATEKEISEPVYFTATLDAAEITVRLDWSKHSSDTDIDLHVVDPYGERICFYHMSSESGGYLDRDDVIGPGPEHIRWADAPAGVYKIYVHYYPNEAPDRSITSYTVSVTAGDITYQPKSGSIAYDQYVPVGQFRIGEDGSTRSVEILEENKDMSKPFIPAKNSK